MTMNIHEILKKLPHRYPFLMVDRVLELEHGKRIKALKNVTTNEPYFVGHFPHRPVMPGVMMLEALAQAAALLSFDAIGAKADDNADLLLRRHRRGALQAAGRAGRPDDPRRHARPHEVEHLQVPRSARASTARPPSRPALMCTVRTRRVGRRDGEHPPTAIVEPGAELAGDVEVGAYSIVRAACPDRRRQRHRRRTA